MILTVTLNPCIDKTIFLDTFVYAGMNRVKETRVDPAGKGINVAVAYKNIGGQVLCTGFNYEDGGRHIEEMLDNSGIEHDFITVKGKLRTNLKIFDVSQKVVTEINESGYPVTENDIEVFFKKVFKRTKDISIIVLSGSVPFGVPDSIYAQIIDMMNSLKKRCLLDAEEKLLSKGCKEKPYLIKPNLHEMESVLCLKLQSISEIIKAARRFIDMGVSIVAVSLGQNGALMIDETHSYHSPAVEIEVKGTAGAGDSMIAGFCLGLENLLPPDELLRYGMAAAAASCMNEGTILCKKEDFEALLSRVTVRKVT